MITRRLLVVSAAASLAVPATAQQWPTKPIKIVVPFPPGQSTDILARVMADQLTKALGQQVLMASVKSGISSVPDLVTKAKAGADLNYGSSGNGSASHLAVEMLRSAAGIKLTHVPYKGNADVFPAVAYSN